MSKETDKMNEDLLKDRDLDRRKKALSEKDLTLREHRVGLDLDILVRNTIELEQAKTIGFGRLTEEEIELLVKEMSEYMLAAKNSMRFINNEFKSIVPYFRKNLLLILADTGHGKSTAVASIAYETITHKNPVTGKTGRVLVLTNEEASEDFYGRIICHIKGWNYTKHDQFTEEQRKTFTELLPILAKDGRLTVIGNSYRGVNGWTRTPEGIENIFNNLIRDKEWYDAIIIDYYQNVNESKVDSRLDVNACQAKLANVLDKFKNEYPAPIVLLAQINRRTDDDDTTPYNVRIKGRKLVCDKATFIMELVPEHELLRSKWTIHKSRFTGTVGQSIYTGFDRGKFVPYSIEFQKNIAKLVERNAERAMQQQAGIVESPEDSRGETHNN